MKFCEFFYSFYFTLTQFREDLKCKDSPKVKNAKIKNVVMNKLEKDLTSTVETSENFRWSTLPTLDIQMWTRKIVSNTLNNP